MTGAAGSGTQAWADARLAAALLAVDGPGLGGVRLRARPGPVRDRWLAEVRALCPERPMPRLPTHADVERLTGGLDLAATLRASRPVGERGLLRQADGGLLLVAMAERLDAGMAATIGMAMDTGRVESALRAGPDDAPVRFAVVALDEGVEADEATPSGLADRLALHLDLDAVTWRDLESGSDAQYLPTPQGGATPFDPGRVARAVRQLPDVRVDPGITETLCAASVALGIASLRAPLLALHVARVAAALEGRTEVDEDDLATAVRLVLAPRATMLPASEPDAEDADETPESTEEDDLEPPPEPEESESEPEPPESSEEDDEEQDIPPEALEALIEQVLEAARAYVPQHLLDASRAARAGRAPGSAGGKSGALKHSGQRGRPVGVRRGRPGPGARLNLVETLRAAAPWQKLRAAESDSSNEPPRVQVRPDDFRVTRFKERRETTTIFVVDASGSAALHRLAEAKGAVELLLADCYVRRDRVALIAFRGTGADVLLPPTRSLVQAKRRLAELPGGGGTPLAAGLDCAFELCDAEARRGSTPVIVVLTDGRANIAADGRPGRERAHDDALAAGRRLRAIGVTMLMIDTSPRPRPLGEELAAAMGARYLPLPHADAAHLSAAVRAEAEAA